MEKSIRIDELKKYFDPLIFDNLDNPVIQEIQHKHITIVFWDVSGFSDACNQLVKGQEAIIAFLQEYFSLASEIIGKHAGVLDKFIGDGIMAYFGYPIENENHSHAAVRAALEIKDRFVEIKERYQTRWNNYYGKRITIDVKCGIHSGFAFCGLIESGNRNQITVIGDDVNFASRLEGIAENDQIIVSDEVHNILEKEFDFQKIYLPPEKRIQSYKQIEYVYLALNNKSLLLTQHPRLNNSNYRILSKDELTKIPFKEKKFLLSKYSDQLKIDSITIKKLGTYSYELTLTLKGSIKKGFIDVLIKDSTGYEYWFPDYKTFDAINYLGRLEMDNQTYSGSMIIDISNILRDQWNFYILIFEDSERGNSYNRYLVSGSEIWLPR